MAAMAGVDHDQGPVRIFATPGSAGPRAGGRTRGQRHRDFAGCRRLRARRSPEPGHEASKKASKAAKNDIARR
jgi:hypothetical protein